MRSKYLNALFISVGILLVSGSTTYSQDYTDEPSQDNSASADAVQDAFPPNFKGHVTYKGSYDGTVQTPGQARRASFGGFGVSVPSMYTRNMSGDYLITIDFNGNSITGGLQTTGGLESGSFKGDRVGSHCRTYNGEYTFDFYCGKSEVRGSFEFTTSRGQHIQYQAHANQTQLVDYAQVAAQQAQQRAEQERQLAAAEARLARDPTAKKLDAVVQIDSRNWAMNRYDLYSMHDAKIIARSHDSVTYRGEFTYNGGMPNWVEVKMQGTDINCIEFGDDPVCRPLGHSLSMRAMRDVMTNHNGARVDTSARDEVQREEQERQTNESIYALHQIEQSQQMQNPE